MPLSHFYEIVPATRERVGDLASVVCGYGHIGEFKIEDLLSKHRVFTCILITGDSNLHLNVACKEFNQEVYQAVEPFVYEYTSKLNGSVSAEHGIGFHKPKYLKYSKKPEAIDFMKDIKQLMDPNGILNPYKVLPSK